MIQQLSLFKLILIMANQVMTILAMIILLVKFVLIVQMKQYL